jgi:hypothetical protein
MIDHIGGWSPGKIGDGYGERYSVTQMKYRMKRITVKQLRSGNEFSDFYPAMPNE